MTSNPRPVLVVDFGVRYAQFIARRVHEVDVYSEAVPHTVSAADMLAKDPTAIVLSGGPSPVYKEGAPSLDPAIFDAGVPILGICYSSQAMAQVLGGAVGRTGAREYGHTEASVTESSYPFDGTPTDQVVWMSHGDVAQTAPGGFEVTALTSQTPVAALENHGRKLFGLQWHPEMGHSAYGQAAFENFLYEGTGPKPVWIPSNVVDEQVEAIKRRVGGAQIICAFSGGVNSSAAATLIHAAMGDQLTCLFIDHGLLRVGRREQVEYGYTEGMGIRVVAVDRSQRFLDALNGVSDPEAKRKIIGREFTRSLEAAQARLIVDIGAKGSEIRFLVQETPYPDIVESGGRKGAASIKSHYNVRGLLEDMAFKLIEPLRALFKDEVRVVGRELGMLEKVVARQPFPGSGLGIYIVREVTCKHLETLRVADLITRNGLTAVGLGREIWQCPVVLLTDVRSVDVRGNGRAYGYPIVLRPVSSRDAMAANWTRPPYDVLTRISTRITNSVSEVNRVVLDYTSRPPGTIEWG